jgi:glycosyltransferase involved in cell wall biosynthesis
MSLFTSFRLDFDVIISNGEVSNLIGLVLSRIKRKPVIMVSHGLASAQPQYGSVVRRLFYINDRLTYPHADAVVTHNPTQMKGITKKYNVVMPGLDKTSFKRLNTKDAKKFRSKYANSDEKVIVYTGRLIGVKGIEFLIRSLKRLKHKYVCIIVGDGPDMEKLKMVSKEENSNVVFTGFRRDIANFLSIADVFVLPSLSESLNYSMIEAACMEVPIVCTDIGVIDSKKVVLVRSSDEVSLASGISRVLSATDKSRVSAAKKYSDSFDWSTAAENYIILMKRVMKR